MAAGRLRAVVHDGLWFHLSTPADLAEAETLLQARLTGEARAEPVHHPAGVPFLDALATEWLAARGAIRWPPRAG